MEGQLIRATFKTELLDEGVEIKDETCPNCMHWVCGLPDIRHRNWKDKRSVVYTWECWNCKTEFIQVELNDKRT